MSDYQRQEIAEIVESVSIIRNKGEQRNWETRVADAILAAGYRKPRSITTAEELDALPVGSVVLTATARPEHPLVVSQKYFNGGDPIWHRGGRLGGTHSDYILPATVLHEPAR